MNAHTLVFGIYPYVALTVLVVGSIIRYDREPYTWRSGSSQLLRRRQLMWGSVLFHAGVLVVFVGHLVGFADADRRIRGIGHRPWRQASHGDRRGRNRRAVRARRRHHAGFTAGFSTLVSAQRRDSETTPSLSCCGSSSFSGLATIPLSLGHLDGHEMLTFMAWAQGIFTFDGEAASYIADAHPVFKLHLFLGLTIFLVFPFTRLVHMLSAPVRYIWRPGYQVVRSRQAAVRQPFRPRSSRRQRAG